uniref:IlvB-like protein n=1 Tax=Chromera velia CCMP2878 TaxID=1169474 RepID=A0A0G4FCB8_9ALVE|eukprot:Cvel_16307.t1-p1 / transcript=Cvel_16307.t1 / gene=Cvel_16307 / organism=Chromera_velia_CCMP2878 / gene_product=Acetolactate synthase-like protein, putative / transcript_product=Acetolactate synthase-like protein, putative / location=Cvel_scaffold1251:35401-39947(-) / protein_length=706 / sequence_SO=supercontig / SO=protein_coding / is_pseudo=false
MMLLDCFPVSSWTEKPLIPSGSSFILPAAGCCCLGLAGFFLFREWRKGVRLPEVEGLPSGGEIVAEVLKEHGVSSLFVLSGGHVAPVYVSAEQKGMRVTSVRHEASAVFAADATGRLKGLGVAVVTAGPGVTNTVTAVKNAQMAQSPVLILGGATSSILKGRGSLQDIDHVSVMKSTVKWHASPRSVRELRPVIERAIRECQTGLKGPVFVELPMDLLWPPSVVVKQMTAMMPKQSNRSLAAVATRWYLTRHLSQLFEGSSLSVPVPVRLHPAVDVRPNHRDVLSVLKMLQTAEKPVLVLGSQVVSDCFEESETLRLVKALETLRIPTFCAGMARGLLGGREAETDLVFRHRRGAALAKADLVILAGAVFDFRLQYGFSIPNRTPTVVINRSREQACMNRQPSKVCVCDPGAFLIRLAEEAEILLKRQKQEESCLSFSFSRSDSAWMAELKAAEEGRDREIYSVGLAVPSEKEKGKTTAADSKSSAAAGGTGHSEKMGEVGKPKSKSTETESKFVHPIKVAMEVNARLCRNSVIVADGGDFVGTAAYVVKPQRALGWLDPGVFGTLGVGGGFALGVKAALRADCVVWVLWGDGACGFSLMELDTFVREGMGGVFVVGNDEAWTQILREQQGILGESTACVLGREGGKTTRYDVVAEGLGAVGFLVEREQELGTALDSALQEAKKGKCALVNVRICSSNFRDGSISV